MKVLHVVGARPNFMKTAPIMREMDRRGGFQQWLIHTGQHYDDGMSRVFFDELGLPRPDEDLGVGSDSHTRQTAEIMLRFEPVLRARKPDWVVVVGDVNSTMACALVAAKEGTRLAHVEAGLRSFDRAMPEELNRLVTDTLADLLLTPSADADENLRRAGIPESRIRRVGNVMIDTLCANLEKARARPILRQLGLLPRSFVYVTLHRPNNVDEREPLAGIMASLTSVALKVPIVFAVHPRTRKKLDEFGLLPAAETGAVRLLEPLGYHDSIALTDAAACVLTDSGGLQEETTYLGVPCLTLRPNTERPITIAEGTNRLTTIPRVEVELSRRLHEDRSQRPPPELWDGHAAERIVDAVTRGR